jgi:transcriptional regulator with XRE-family HTH domain
MAVSSPRVRWPEHGLRLRLVVTALGEPPLSRRDDPSPMDDVVIGSLLRSIRVRLGLRQVDVAGQAEVSQQQLSVLERGGLEHVSIGAARRLATAVGASLVVTIRWRGAELDRLKDEDHALVVGQILAILEMAGWLTATEVTYASFGERGSIDVLAFHPGSRTLLVIEVKTEIASVEETIRRLDAKARLAPAIALERFGWRAARVSRLLAVLDSRTARRRVERHGVVLTRAFPLRGWAARSWLRSPGPAAGLLLFLTPTRVARGTRGPATTRRLRRREPRTNQATPPGSEARETAEPPRSPVRQVPERT